jgi:hypothetical protein
MKNILMISMLMIMISSCSSRATGKYEILLDIDTLNNKRERIVASCKLYSSETRVAFTTPNKINYSANCGPINIVCQKGKLSGEFGVVPKKEEVIQANTIISGGLGIIFDRIVNTTTPFGMFVRYTNTFDNSVCLIPKEIKLILE